MFRNEFATTFHGNWYSPLSPYDRRAVMRRQQHRRPGQRVKDRVVLADEVHDLAIRILPPPRILFRASRRAAAHKRRREATRTRSAHRTTRTAILPFASGSSSGTGTPHVRSRVIARSGSPPAICPATKFSTVGRHGLALCPQPLLQPRPKLIQPQIPVHRLAQLRRRARHNADSGSFNSIGSMLRPHDSH